MKVLFFHVPSLGMYHLIEPILVELVERGHTVIHYNAAAFRRYVTNPFICFRSYKDYQGYLPSLFSSGMNLYDLGLLLLDTAEHMLDFVESEVLQESPDLILHSKFMAAPKVIASKHRVPAVCLTTGYVFHPSVVLDRNKTKSSPVNLSNVSSLWKFKKRAKGFYGKYLGGSTDENDIFVNEEALNLVLGLERFQPRKQNISSQHKFIGPTVQVKNYSKSYELIYVSLGSVFVGNPTFFQLCIQALGKVSRRAIISLSDRLSPAEFDDVPPNVELASFVPQREILQRAAVFITHGGASSVYEAIYCATPMIVIPQIPEQLFYAREIETLMLGKCIEPKDLTIPLLQSTVSELLADDRYARNVQAFKETLPKLPAAVTACDHIEEMALKAGSVGWT
jgi:MGT family glycosyltransferase